MIARTFTALVSALAASAAFIPSNSSDPVNSTISIYTDPVLQRVAQSPPTAYSYAAVNFTNGIRTLPNAYFHFTEQSGTAANLTVSVIEFAFPSNLSTTNNIFAYHVHEFPIAAGDNTCMSAGGHYDPFRANGTLGLVNATNGAPSPLYHPSPANLSTFQIGDLAGKWGALTSVNGSLEARTIIEHYIRLSGEYSVMSRSVVIHDAPTDTRIACGNITMVTQAFAASGSSNSSGGSTTGTGGSGALMNTASLGAVFTVVLATMAIMV